MNKENIRKVILAILFVLILVVIALFIGLFTYSYLGPAPTDELKGTGEVTPSGDTIIFSKGNDLSLSASTDNFHTGSGNLTDTTNPQVRLIASSDTNNASTTYYAGIRIYENTYTYSTTNETAELILSVYDENGNLLQASSDALDYVTVGDVSGFDITGLTGAYNIAIDHPISTTSSTNGTTHTWTFTLTFVNLDTDQSINETANLEMEVVLQKDRIEMPTIEEICSDEANSSLLTCHILSQYTTDGVNGIYYHDADLENGAGDNSYRYAGANPNNYVCFGSDEETCPEDNLYRIIGVFGSEVKIIKAASYGDYVWDSGNSNTWSTSDIKNTLNTTYYNTLSSTWQNKIATHTWKVGGMTSGLYTAKQYYDVEVGSSSSSTTDSMKIGLMYVSDYGFSSDISDWNIPMNDYFYADSYSGNNWLCSGLYEWTISSYSSNSNIVFSVFYDGNLHNRSAYYGSSARPVFYLNSNVSYVSGDGSQSNPFRIK